MVLIGFMGTGKSTVSKLLSEELGWTRIDVDEEIERMANKRVSDIFAEDGEAEFRALETRALAEILLSDSSAVVATGGGAVLKEENRRLMLENGHVVALKASPESIIARVKTDTSRPLLQGDAAGKVKELMEKRKQAYDFAHVTVDTTNMTADEVVQFILDRWNQGQ